ncbi:putative F-box/LRR-repeat protein isoform X2 [Tanacetum coccineum]
MRDVNISEYVLHKLLSTCKLLEKINLKLSEGLRKIQVNNLRYLHELKIAACGYLGYLEISNVPCLRSLSYNETLIIWRPVSSNTDSIGSLRELCLNYVSMDDECSDMINSKFPFLESLTLTLICCHMETFDIRCVSLRRLTIRLMEKKQIKVQVCSPKLLFFSYECNTLPDFLFPSIAPEQFVLHMRMFNAIDDKFFLKLRDVLSLSSKFTIDLKCFGSMVPFDIEEVRRRITFPATNVEYLLFETYDKVLWEKSLIIDVLFSICHPDCIMVNRPLTHKVANYLLNPNIEKMETKTGNVYRPHLKDGDAKWEALTSSSKTSLCKWCEFKPNWCSQ